MDNLAVTTLTRIEYDKAYYKKNKLKRIKQNLIWVKNNRKRALNNQKRWRKANPTAQKEWENQHPSFINWRAMIARCFYTKAINYSYYGKRGIKVYKPWQTFSRYEREFGIKKPNKNLL